jgi:hypothetical protein
MYQVGNAIVDIIQTGERFPTVSQIRAIASGYREFKTVAVEPKQMIEEFTTVDDVPVDADSFFKKVGGYFK